MKLYLRNKVILRIVSYGTSNAIDWVELSKNIKVYASNNVDLEKIFCNATLPDD